LFDFNFHFLETSASRTHTKSYKHFYLRYISIFYSKNLTTPHTEKKQKKNAEKKERKSKKKILSI